MNAVLLFVALLATGAVAPPPNPNSGTPGRDVPTCPNATTGTSFITIRGETSRCCSDGFCDTSSCVTAFNFPNSAKSNCQNQEHAHEGHWCGETWCDLVAGEAACVHGSHCWGISKCGSYSDDGRGQWTLIKSDRTDCQYYGHLCLQDGGNQENNFKVCGDVTETACVGHWTENGACPACLPAGETASYTRTFYIDNDGRGDAPGDCNDVAADQECDFASVAPQNPVLACEALDGDTETITCDVPICPVTCEGYWSEFSACSATCGVGTKTKTWIVTTPAAGTGTPCPGPHTESCNLGACPPADPEECMTEINGADRECCEATGACKDSSCTVFGYASSEKSNCPGANNDNQCGTVSEPATCAYLNGCVPGSKTENHCYGYVSGGSREGMLCLEDGNSGNFKICGSQVDCEYEWSAWSPICEGENAGTKTRTAIISQQPDIYGGLACPDPESVPHNCPVDCAGRWIIGEWVCTGDGLSPPDDTPPPTRTNYYTIDQAALFGGAACPNAEHDLQEQECADVLDGCETIVCPHCDMTPTCVACGVGWAEELQGVFPCLNVPTVIPAADCCNTVGEGNEVFAVRTCNTFVLAGPCSGDSSGPGVVDLGCWDPRCKASDGTPCSSGSGSGAVIVDDPIVVIP